MPCATIWPLRISRNGKEPSELGSSMCPLWFRSRTTKAHEEPGAGQELRSAVPSRFTSKRTPPARSVISRRRSSKAIKTGQFSSGMPGSTTGFSHSVQPEQVTLVVGTNDQKINVLEGLEVNAGPEAPRVIENVQLTAAHCVNAQAVVPWQEAPAWRFSAFASVPPTGLKSLAPT